MEVKKCARCHRMQPLSLFEKFKSGRERATCNRCIQRDNYPVIDRVSPLDMSAMPQTRLTENFNQTVPPHVLSPVSLNHGHTDQSDSPFGAKTHPRYASQNPRDSCCLSTDFASPKYNKFDQSPRELGANQQNSGARLMPSLDAIASLQPDLAPLLSNLNDSGSYVLLYVPCKMHHK